VVLHELVSGTTPWEVGGTLLSHHAARKKPRPPLAAHGAPPALDVLLDRALCLERAGRTASAAAFARELEGLLGRPEESAAGRPRRSLGLARAGALLVIVALGVAAYLQRQAARRELADAKRALEPVERRLEGVEARIFGSGTTSDDSSTIDDAIHRAERAEAAARRAERFLLADAAPLLSAALAVEDRARGLERLRLAASAPRAGLADLAPTFYEHGLATGSQHALDIGWRLAPPEGELARRIARRWIDLAEEATTRNAGQDLEKKKESRAGLRDAVELSRRIEKLVPEEGLRASWRVASVIREAREKTDSASKETDRLVIEIFAPWPEHPRCRAALAREAFGHHDRETALTLSLEGLDALPPRPGTESDYPDLPETIYDLCWAWGDNGTYVPRDSPALARPAVERVLAAANRGGNHVLADAWARLAQAACRAGDAEGGRRCFEAGRSSPDAESWPVDLERAEIFVLVAEKNYDEVIGRLRKHVPVEPGADLPWLAATLEEGDPAFARAAHETLGDPW
jgi:hypothetical protein